MNEREAGPKGGGRGGRSDEMLTSFWVWGGTVLTTGDKQNNNPKLSKEKLSAERTQKNCPPDEKKEARASFFPTVGK